MLTPTPLAELCERELAKLVAEPSVADKRQAIDDKIVEIARERAAMLKRYHVSNAESPNPAWGL